MHALWTQQDFLLLRILVHVLPLCIQLQARAPDARLVTATTTVALRGGERRTRKSVEQRPQIESTFAKTPPTYLLLGDVLLSLLLFHSEFVVHLFSSFTNIFPLAQLVHVRQAFPGLPFRFLQDVLYLWIVLEQREQVTLKIA